MVGIVQSLSSVDWDSIFRPHATEKFSVQTNMNTNVGILRLFPGITTAAVSQHKKKKGRESERSVSKIVLKELESD